MVERLRQQFEAEPSQEAGLALASALEELGRGGEALAVAERALACEMDFSESELRPWTTRRRLEELAARLRFPRPELGELERTWRVGRAVYGVRAGGQRLLWFVRYPGGRESGIPQTLSSFVDQGPQGAALRPTRAVVRELARRLEAEERPWFAAYRRRRG